MTSSETVPAVGSIRRLQALAVAGWPWARIARESGLAPARLHRILTATVVTAEDARAVSAVYDRLSMVSPGLCGVPAMYARAARARAAELGWAPVGAWDDDTIDDPDVAPEWTGHCGTIRGADLHARHGIPVCPRCQAALDRRQQYRLARALRGLPATRA
ncbi:hypothetical protein [Streptomyces sp. G1]|uniref:hypothetical protein n=1 Tax=Streptomyces sp. G1 TaxID=361572 RepID=UPI00202EEB41|nr:hypothetical protein [Streptomyces sp. G1]MCM1974603.1 hypothetical protein [Streptomyces sp. G1]